MFGQHGSPFLVTDMKSSRIYSLELFYLCDPRNIEFDTLMAANSLA